MLLALLALVIVIGIQAAGIVLVMAMLITPAATAYLLARRFVGVMFIGALIGAVSAVAGLYLSFHVDDLPSGPAMALVATGIFGVSGCTEEGSAADPHVPVRRLGWPQPRRRFLSAAVEPGMGDEVSRQAVGKRPLLLATQPQEGLISS